MKKLLLLTLIFVINITNAQFSKQGYGWKFQSHVNYNDYTKEKHYGAVEFYYNINNDNIFKVVYANGVTERFRPYSVYPYQEGYTKSGYKYQVFPLICLETEKIVTLQVFKELEIIRLLYDDVMIEFSY